ncbi:hypothetical protein [Halobacteriovorax sp. JY17]|uniref:type IV pilus modification PilV family protein n=1 Tax=Halobacteriovorax sp. JY17 TaxID=2014617 RepID=UPI000C4FD69D|nr:hypothetical protein [Halobacteriovorax sp. JY17]PIK15691.1 MAG: hypothetical protein CES88_02895 [Halobacteriovorax sp. JY17]
MLHNDRGFSLVQVLISSGLLGAAALVGIKIMATQERMAKNTNQKYEIGYIHEEIWRNLQDPSSCEATFSNLTLTEISDGAIKYISKKYSLNNENRNTSLYRTYSNSRQLYGAKNLKIQSYTAVSREGSLEPIFDFFITFDKGADSLGSKTIAKGIPIVFSTSNSKIVNCNALPISSENEEGAQEKDTTKLKIIKHLGINTPPLEGATLAIESTISFDTQSELSECSPENQGMIRYDDTNENLLLCTGSSSWKSWGVNNLDWSRPTRVVSKTSKTDTQIIGEYKLCVLGAVEGSNHNQCHLSAPETDLIRLVSWELRPSINDLGSCTFLCFK